MHDKIQNEIYQKEDEPQEISEKEERTNFQKKKSGIPSQKNKNDLLNTEGIKLNSNEYVIQQNDTFWEIENRFGIEHGTLIYLNPQLDPKNLQPGQKIYIESVQVSPLKFFTALSLKINLGQMGYTKEEIAFRLNAFINDHSINDFTLVGDCYGQMIEMSMDFIRQFQEISGHTLLDVAGLVPGLGEVFDAANGVWYYVEGDNANGTLSMSAAVPFLGWSATAGKWSYKAFRAFGKHGEALFEISQKIERLSKHLDYKHVTAAYNDILGKYIVIGNKTYDHLKEVTEALDGVRKQLRKLEGLIKSGKLSQGALNRAVDMRSTIQNNYDAINKYLSSAYNKLP